MKFLKTAFISIDLQMKNPRFASEVSDKINNILDVGRHGVRGIFAMCSRVRHYVSRIDTFPTPTLRVADGAAEKVNKHKSAHFKTSYNNVVFVVYRSHPFRM